MEDKTEWTGFTGELLEAIPDLGEPTNSLTKKLNVFVSILFNEFGIAYTLNRRTSDRRTFTLLHTARSELHDDNITENDSETGCAVC
ncbi:MAG: hypothetical protein HUJ67_05560 [Ruminiclostridium sp.]|nr:hypothetical protein [Ruminiclostridium sp.]MCF0134109.1 hypothetical protein [Blautia sp.]